MSALRTTIAAAIRIAKSKPPRTLKDVLLKDVWIPDGPYKNTKFRFDRQPVTELWVNEIDSGRWNDHVFSAPSQFGKTLIGYVAPLVYHTCELGENYVLGVPLADMAANKWEADVQPLLAASPKLRRFLPTHGSGSAGGKVRDSITLANGSIIKLMGAVAKDQGKAAFTSRVVGLTEAAGFSKIGESSAESDPLRQLRARQRAYAEILRRTYIEGTITLADALPYALKELSTGSTIPAPCPHCGKFIEPDREHLVGWQDARSEDEAGEQAHWECPQCHEPITEEQRKTTLADSVLLHRGQTIDRRGRIRGKDPETSRLWFHCRPWHNCFLSAGDIGRDEWRAAKIPDDTPERMSADRELCQFVWSSPWKPPKWDDDLELDARIIPGRRCFHKDKPIARTHLPDDTVVVTTGVDLGKRKGWYLTLATRMGIDGVYSRHVCDYGAFDVPSDDRELDNAIKYSLAELWDQLSAGYTMPGNDVARDIDQLWYDANWKPKPVLAHVRELNGLNRFGRHFGAYGRGQTTLFRTNYTAPRKTGNEIREIDPHGLYYLSKIQHSKTLALTWDSDTTKYQVQQALTLPEKKPGSVTLYAGTSKEHERLTRHLLAERYVTEFTAIGERSRWIRKGANHLFDCFAMAWRAADRVLKIGPPRDSSAEPGKASTDAEGWYD